MRASLDRRNAVHAACLVLAFGGPPECPERAYCLPGLKQTYGLRFETFIPLDAGGPLTPQALDAGDIALLFSTDPAITAQHLVVLADDCGLPAGRERHSAGAP